MKRWQLFIPLVLFVVLGVFLFRGLSLDPQHLPSARLGTPLPAFDLPTLSGDERINEQHFRGQVALINVWATWCAACRIEHPYLNELKQQGVVIYGLNYKDDAQKAQRWLDELGDPYTRVIADQQGRFGLDLGVYGAPETYLVDAQGIVRYRHVGVVNEPVWREVLAPLYQRYQQELKP